MRVESNNICTSNNFTSRNPVIRKADDIVRRVNRVYPGISLSRLEDFNNIEHFPDLFEKFYYKLKDLRLEIDSIINETDVNKFPNVIKKAKIRNCGESAMLAGIAARTNGIDKFYKYALWSDCAGNLDHSVVLVRNGGKPYIMDAWLGFADYVPKAMERYKSEFGHHFELDGNPSERLFLKPQYSGYLKLVKSKEQEVLRKMFPDLIVGKNCKNQK